MGIIDMATAALIARKPDGTILYDTSKSIYGLIKAGPVTYTGDSNAWRRLQLNGAPSYYIDKMYKFEVENAVSPIVFVYGTSGKPFQSQEGNKQVFYFAGPVENIRVYCFDLMRPILIGPALKTRDPGGSVTFNSLQFPLNVKGASMPPPPSNIGGGFVRPFDPWTRNGVLTDMSTQPIAGALYWESKVSLDASKKYAAHIPWNRGASWVAGLNEGGGNAGKYRGAGEEGCYGTDGGVAHVFWTSPETTFGSVPTTTQSGWFNLLGDKRPLCSYIDIAEYPYPFDPTN